MRLRRPSPAILVALVALVIALGGTAVAASRYIITSTSQIKPSVLRELRSSAVAAAVPKGPKAILNRVGLAAPVATATETVQAVPLTSATWTQAAHQINVIAGQVTVSRPPQGQCESGGYIEVELDGSPAGIGTAFIKLREPYEATTTYQFAWSPPYPPGGEESNATWLIDQNTAISHTLSARASDSCRDGSHFTITAIQIDVLGFR